MAIQLVPAMSKMGAVSVLEEASHPIIVLIHTKALIAESLVSGLRIHDALAKYHVFPSLDAWLESDLLDASLVIFHVSVLSRDPEVDVDRFIENVSANGVDTKFVIMSEIEDASFILRCMNKKSSGYISTGLTLAVVVQALYLVLAGGNFVPWTAVLHLSEQPTKGLESTPRLQVLLSSKEAQVARELRKGTPNKVIAYNLNMCESTVKVHVRNIMRKLNAKNRTEVAYISNELVEFDDARLT